MEFALDNEWIVGSNTDSLNRELFGDTKANKSKQSRRRKRKRVKTVYQQNTVQKHPQQISLPSDTAPLKKLISLKEHCSPVHNVKKRRRHNTITSESATNYMNNLRHHTPKQKGHNRHKHQKLGSSTVDLSESQIKHSCRVNCGSELRKEKTGKKGKLHKQNTKNNIAHLVAKKKLDIENKPLIIFGKSHRNSLKSSKRINEGSTENRRPKRATNSVKSSLKNSISSDNQLSLTKLPNSDYKSFPLGIKKLKDILKSAQSSHTTNPKSKNRNKGILIVGKGKREEYSDIVRKQAVDKLKSARFRFINEKMYTTTGKESMHLFKFDPNAFEIYHDGFQSQVDKWPLNPVNAIINDICKKPKELTIADFGCGNAKIAQAFPNRKVYSFDLISMNNYVTACDMANVPLAKNSVDIAIFCLALMGTNLNDYLCEAHRVLKRGGLLKIAEVISRMENADTFIENLKEFGFTLLEKNITHKMFIFLDFTKTQNFDNTQLPTIELKPCLYKKR